jgi:hypothetical protein
MFKGDEILTWLQVFADNNRPVRLINAYRGIPVAYSARVIMVGAGNAVFGINEYQAVCLALDGKTHIQHPDLPEILRARAVAVNVPLQEATLTEFVKVGSSLGNRLCTRVQPKEPIDAEIKIGTQILPCQLMDISLNGVGVITLGTYTYGDLEAGKGSKVQLFFTLPPTHTPVQLVGQITSVAVGQSSQQHRLGCKTFPDSNVDLLLLEYVALRRDELMRELSMVYATMRREQLKPAVSP